MIGRGTSDDKGPGVAAVFAMKAILNAGIPLRRRCRLILGCDEECGMQDLEYYEQKIGLPDRGFSPDANFPLINTEKGGLKLALHAALDDARLIEIASGTRVNVVPNQAVAVLAGDWREAAADAFDVDDEDCALESELVDGNTRLTVTGVSAHASVPEKGKNAAKMLVHVLAKLGIGGAPIALLDEAAGRESAGEDLGIAGSDKVSGALTINLGLLFAREGKIDVTFDCRYPVFFNPETIGETVQRRLAPAGYALEPIKPSVPHHVPESSELVAKLMDVYNTITAKARSRSPSAAARMRVTSRKAWPTACCSPANWSWSIRRTRASMWRTSLKLRVSMRMLSSPCAHKRRKRRCCHIMRR